MSFDSYLVLARFFMAKLGGKTVADFRGWQALEDAPSPDGHTAFFRAAIEAATPDFMPRLENYDRRIRTYEERLRNRRQDFSSFKYFQYLTLLATEYHLDRVTSDPQAYLMELNNFLSQQKAANELDQGIEPFTDDDLRCIAFYLATGSGKTILLHVHYWQIRYYVEHGNRPDFLFPKGLGHYLLLVPTAGLAEQHLEELSRSGIPGMHLTLVKHYPSGVLPGTVLVIDMPKLRAERAKDESEAEGVYYPILGQSNIVFVDEGHKGTARADGAWRKIREYLSGEGLLFEYSATFRQVLTNANRRCEYGKRILVDYEYRYFYHDGYGKYFQPIDVDPSDLREEEYEDAALMGGLLLYYRQLSLYLRKQEIAKAYNIERPLWVFVGHTVTVTRESDGELGEVADDKATLTDVAKAVRFIARFLEEREWSIKLLDRAIHSQDYIGAHNPFGPHLQEFQGRDPKELYRQIRETVFGGEGVLELHLLPSKGEIGLRVSGSRRGHYFGLIAIGDVAAFRKIVEEQLGLDVVENPLFVELGPTGLSHRSLFQDINRDNSPVNVLIGARKFREGWSSFRVSTMTLLYVGRNEGPEIIQLFGRGIRLLGKNNSLKRSGESWLRPLETLYILGLRADYIKQFLDAVSKEDMLESIELPLDRNEAALSKPLPIPRVPTKFEFERQTIRIEVQKEYSPTVKLAPRIRAVYSEDRAFVAREAGSTYQFSSEEIQAIDWPRVLAQLRRYARTSGYDNISVRERELREIIEKGFYSLEANSSDFQDPTAVEEAVLIILRRYLDRFFRAKLNEAQTRVMERGFLRPEEVPTKYVVYAPKDSEILRKLRELHNNLRQWRTSAPAPLPRLYLDQSVAAVYHPLVYETKGSKVWEAVRISPSPLNESEYTFVKALEEFWARRHLDYPAVHLYLMRNPAKTGLGFHYKSGFYPDFILWIEHPERWRVVFVEPHGMRNESIEDNPKLDVFTRLLPKLNSRPEFKQSGFEIDGYILTSTNPQEIHGVSQYGGDWERLARERHLLLAVRGTEANLRTICNLE